MKTVKKLAIALTLSIMLMNLFYLSYQDGKNTAYAAFVVDDITLGVAAVIVLSSAVTAEYFRSNPAQFEKIVDGVKSSGGTAGEIFATIGAQISAGVAVQLSLMQQAWDAIKGNIKNLVGYTGLPASMTLPGEVPINPTSEKRVVGLFSTSGEYLCAVLYYKEGLYYRTSMLGVGGFRESLNPMEVSIYDNGLKWTLSYTNGHSAATLGISKDKVPDNSISLHWYPSLQAYEADRVVDWRAAKEGQGDIISVPDVLPADLPDSLTADRQAVERWKNSANPAIPKETDLFPTLKNPAIPNDETIPGNPDIPKNPPANNPPWFPDISNILNKILNFLKSMLDALKAIPALLTNILTALKTMFDVSKFKLDFSGLKVQITDRFPFCIPFDLLNAVKVFAAQARTPEFRVNLNTSYFKIDDRIDLGLIAYPLGFFRMVAVWYYIVFLMRKTRDFIKW